MWWCGAWALCFGRLTLWGVLVGCVGRVCGWGCCCGVLRGVVCEGVPGVHVWSVLEGRWVGSLGGLCGWGVLLGSWGDGLG